MNKKEKNLIFNPELRSRILSGAEKMFKSISVTLGGDGRYVFIQMSDGTYKVTKDGVTVAKEINLEDDVENFAASTILDACFQTLREVGDGTTAVLAYHMIEKIFGDMTDNQDVNFRKYLVGMEIAKSSVIDSLKQYPEYFKNNNQEIPKEVLVNVATTSSNNDQELGKLIGGIFHRVGVDGNVKVVYKNIKENDVKFVDGYILEEGLIAKEFTTESSKCVMKDPLILITNRTIDDVDTITPIMDFCHGIDRPLLVVAGGYSREVTLTMAKNMDSLICCPIKAMNVGDRKNSYLEDLAVVTGGIFINGEKDMFLENAYLPEGGNFLNGDFDSDKIMEHLGSCESLEVGIETTSIYHKNHKEIADQIKLLQDMIPMLDNEIAKEFTEKRISKLMGKEAVIELATSTRTEMSFDFDRIDDALRSTKSALKSGISPGGGTAYIKAAIDLESIKSNNVDRDVQLGIECVRKSLYSIIEISLLNGNYTISEIEEIIGRIYSAIHDGDIWFGYNSVTKGYGDMKKLGVLESGASSGVCFSNAFSISKILANTGCGITIIPQSLI